jgi:hypothetical protein
MKTITRLADLTPDPHNANRGTKRGLDLLTRRNAIAISFLPQLLEAAEENAVGRRVLASLAREIVTPESTRLPVRDRLEGVMRLAHLADDFQHAPGGHGYHPESDFYFVAEILRALADGFLEEGKAILRVNEKLSEERRVQL